MRRPVCLDTFCCGQGAGVGYQRAGYDVYGIEIDPKRLRDAPLPYLVGDAMEALIRLKEGEGLTFSDGRTLHLDDIDLIHGSPPCQGYSIMNNLPWIRKRTYPLLILPLREILEDIGKPYVIENVAGAASKRHLEKLGLLEHRLRAGWLCGGMFGLPIYRHRYFETNWFWPMPGHPKHVRTRQAESSFSPRPLGVWETEYEAEHPGRSAQAARVNTGWRAGHDGQGAIDKRHPSNPKRFIAISRYTLVDTAIAVAERTRSSLRAGYLETTANPIGHSGGNGAQREGVPDGHAAGWKVAAAAMGISWMRRSELTQAIPPCMTEYLASWALKVTL